MSLIKIADRNRVLLSLGIEAKFTVNLLALHEDDEFHFSN